MNPELEPCIFVEGPRRASAEFYGKWLLGLRRPMRSGRKSKRSQATINYKQATDRTPEELRRTHVEEVRKLVEANEAIMGTDNKTAVLSGKAK